MAITDALRGETGALFAVCALAAALEVVARDDGAALGFRAACGLAIACCALRAVSRIVGSL